MAPVDFRDIVVLIPGILGSVLYNEDGTPLWEPSVKGVWKAATSQADFVSKLTVKDKSSGDGVRPVSLMPDISILPGVWKIDGYGWIADRIRQVPGIVEGDIFNHQSKGNFFQFPYDWRLDCRRNSKILSSLIGQKVEKWASHTGTPPKLIILAHSMGGLIARHFLEIEEGWKSSRALITFGTPFRGSVNAVKALVEGSGSFGVDLSPALKTFRSVFQLLPTRDEIIWTGEVWTTVGDCGAFEDDIKNRISDAADFHNEISEKEEVNRSAIAEYTTDGYALLSFVGIDQPTLQHYSLAAATKGGQYDTPPALDQSPNGDGTVPRWSATGPPSKGSFGNTFLCELHASMQNNRYLLTDLIARLGQMQVGRLPTKSVQRSVDGAPGLVLELGDLFQSSEGISASIGLTTEMPPPPHVEAHNTDQNRKYDISEEFVKSADRWILRACRLPPGAYRVTACLSKPINGFFPPPVTDVTAVIEV